MHAKFPCSTFAQSRFYSWSHSSTGRNCMLTNNRLHFRPGYNFQRRRFPILTTIIGTDMTMMKCWYYANPVSSETSLAQQKISDLAIILMHCTIIIIRMKMPAEYSFTTCCFRKIALREFYSISVFIWRKRYGKSWVEN